MQLLLICGIGFALVAVLFALQNNAPVSVALAFWHFDGSLAVVLLLALGLGAIIAGLVSSPAMIKGQWAAARLRRRIGALESDNAALVRRVGDLEAELARQSTQAVSAAAQAQPLAGLNSLPAGGKSGHP